MIYGYKYLDHKIQNFHDGILYFFNYLFTNNIAVYDSKVMFSKEFEPLIEASPKFKPLLVELVEEYHKQTPKQKKLVIIAFSNNNQIEKLCKGELEPIKYDDIGSVFSTKLKDFSEKLWTEYHHNQKIEKSCGTIKSHFDDFVDVKHQVALLCPFCGFTGLEPGGGEYRDAYDHYLPKSIYPFISLNFENLVPTCHHCNSYEKGKDEVIFDKSGKRRRVFYPFDKSINSKNISFIIKPEKKKGTKVRSTLLSKINWDYEIKVGGVSDVRAQAWHEIYGIKRRYKERLPGYEKTWYELIKSEFEKSYKANEIFNSFKKRFLGEIHKEILIMPLGLLKYSYIYYQLSKSDIEQVLTYYIRSNSQKA